MTINPADTATPAAAEGVAAVTNPLALSGGEPALLLAGVRKDYGDRAVLRGVNLQLPRGEVAALFGDNGAGKTTLLRIAAGLTRPDAGEVRIGGRRAHRRGGGAARRLVGFAGHQPLLYNDLSCRENLLFYARLHRVRDAPGRIAAALAQVNLSERADRRAGTLSHGMQKRLDMARAILHRPLLLLLDEPESGLDAASADTLGRLLGEWAAAGRTALLTTHRAETGQAWADRALRLSRGRLTDS